MATREICKCYGRENPLGFSVPDHVWEMAVPPEYRNRVLCILCFDYYATLSGVDWTATLIEWYPVSGADFALWAGQDYQEVAERSKDPLKRSSLTDEERKAIFEFRLAVSEAEDEDVSTVRIGTRHAATLRNLLERMGGTT